MVDAPGDRSRDISQSSAVGPWFRSDRVVVRYGAAVLFVVAIFALRVLLTPIMGTQAPCSFHLGRSRRRSHRRLRASDACDVGRPAARNAALRGLDLWRRCRGLGWPRTFFVVIGASVALILHRLQEAVRDQQRAATLARAAEAKAKASDAQVRLIADGVPFLICYVGADQVFRFVNANYAAWFDRPITEIVGRACATCWAKNTIQKSARKSIGH